jgi:hypothetical protein
MVLKHELFENVPLHVQELNYVYEMEDHVRAKLKVATKA